MILLTQTLDVVDLRNEKDKDQPKSVTLRDRPLVSSSFLVDP